ncbi:hypothetical protein [Nonomuraea sp. GTA35]|uniref:hypothetical protein n=1 Tax=Nonomuraea sp. GTA35 TaxID=1676746 RepID=UPI0035C14865
MARARSRVSCTPARNWCCQALLSPPAPTVSGAGGPHLLALDLGLLPTGQGGFPVMRGCGPIRRGRLTVPSRPQQILPTGLFVGLGRGPLPADRLPFLAQHRSIFVAVLAGISPFLLHRGEVSAARAAGVVSLVDSLITLFGFPQHIMEGPVCVVGCRPGSLRLAAPVGSGAVALLGRLIALPSGVVALLGGCLVSLSRLVLAGLDAFTGRYTAPAYVVEAFP